MGRRLDSHRNLFHAARNIEPMLLAWSTKHRHRALDDIFWHDIPSFRWQETRTFGDFIDDLGQIAKEYSCAIPSASNEAREMPITGREAYAMAMYVLVQGITPSSTMKRVGQLIPVVKDIVSMIETWGSFKHPAYGKKIDVDAEFVYYAKAGFVYSGADLDDFNKDRARSRAAKASVELRKMFAEVPGEFGNQMLSYAVIVAGDDHGVAQAKRALGDDFEP